MKNLKAQIFLEKANGSDMGRWYSLPMNEKELNELLYNNGLIISDYDIECNFASYEVTKEYIRDFNTVLNSKDERLLTLFMWADKDLNSAKEAFEDIDNPCFLYLEGIEDGNDYDLYVQIGRKIADLGLLGYVPANLIEKDYIDFESIGRDYWEGGASHYEPSTKAVFIQTSSR